MNSANEWKLCRSRSGRSATAASSAKLTNTPGRVRSLDLNGLVILLISGTASIDEHGASIHVGDFRAQCRRIFQNISALLAAEGATWKDVVRTSCYLRDIDRDYALFNEERTAFYKEQGLNPLPASTGIQAKLCRPELLVELEAIAMFRQLPKE